MLRVGVLLDSPRVPFWLHAALRRMAGNGRVSVEVVAIRNLAPAPTAAQGPVARLLATCWTELAERSRPQPDAFAPTDTSALWGGAPLLRGDEGLRALQAAGLDVIVKTGASPLPEAAQMNTRHGVWSYATDTPDSRPLPRTDRWQHWKETRVDFPVLKNLVDHRTLYASNSAALETGVIQNRNAAYLKASAMLDRCLTSLAEHGATSRQATSDSPPPAVRSSARPSAGALARGLAGFVYERLARKASSLLYFNQWRLAYDLSDDLSTDLRRFKEIVPPKDRFWADPFVLRRDGHYYLFVEEYLYAKGKAHISLIVMDENGRCEQPVTLIDEPHHMSYPFVLEHDGELYMIPEAHATRTVPLYRCVEFPYAWRREGVLFDDIDAVDPTLLFHDGRWWLFMNVIESEGASSYDELFVYSSDDPIGRSWTPHPLNPVVSDIASARPAGRIFSHEGRLYRPAQDSGQRYGHRLKLNRIVELTATTYREEPDIVIGPDWSRSVLATHTFCRVERLTLVDAQFRRARYW